MVLVIYSSDILMQSVIVIKYYFFWIYLVKTCGRVIHMVFHNANKFSLNQRTESVIVWLALAIYFLEDWRGLIEKDRKREEGISREISEAGGWRKMWREISANQLSTVTWIYQVFIPISDSRVFIILSQFR